MALSVLPIVSIVCTLVTLQTVSATGSFQVDYANDRFLKDGQPFRYISGSLHYFRVPKAYWRDRMQKMRLAGLNALQTYVEWSGHEFEPGQFNFDGDYDLKAFLDTAKDVGLLVILRPGPYICAERDNGGLPYWLLRLNPNMKYRTSDPSYIAAVDRWFDVLLPMVEPYLYKNGGPIITVQVENEYGQYTACDQTYMHHLVNITRRYLGEDVVLFRTDTPGPGTYECDRVDGTLAAADFQSTANVAQEFSIIRKAMKRGPLIVAEYYPGWMDGWGQPHAKVDQTTVLKTFEEILSYNASVNFYMFHGGTNFGFTNGATPPPQPTSYDYGAPLTEAGDPRQSYFRIRDVVGRYLPLPNGTLPTPAPKLKLGPATLTSCVTLESVLAYLRAHGYVKQVTSQQPLTFEELGQAHGYVVYTTTVSFRARSPAKLTVPGIKDRGYVLTAQTRAVLSSDRRVYTVPVVVKPGENITVVVENTGRINVGTGNRDMKGILGEVTLDKHILTGWTMEVLPLSNHQAVGYLASALAGSASETDRHENCPAPGAFFGEFVLPEGQPTLDTFLDPTGWGKGVAYVNNFNLGRYWPSVGPQVTLYVPGVLLLPHPNKNSIVLFEMEAAPSGNWTVNFPDKPNIDGPVPDDWAT